MQPAIGSVSLPASCPSTITVWEPKAIGALWVIHLSPAGLTVDIKTKDGGVVEVTTNQPGINYEDGDIIAILSGNNDALIEVKIDRNNKWTTKFISRYGLTSS